MLAGILAAMWTGIKTLVKEVIYAVTGEFFIRLIF